MRTLIGLHLLVSAAAEAAFAWKFGHAPRAVAGHLLLLAVWDAALVAIAGAVASFSRPPLARLICCVLMAVTASSQVYLYALNVVSNASWGRNITAHLVIAFAPTVWSGKEPFPIGPLGIALVLSGTCAVMLTLASFGTRRIAPGLDGIARIGRRRATAAAAVLLLTVAGVGKWAVDHRDDLLWRDEVIASFFRPQGYAFEPTARRDAVAEHDAVLRASYPRHVPGAQRKNIVLIIVDSLRADRMQAYGYARETTPFLAEQVRAGRMKKVEAAFSSCSESFCGITSTLASREFRDISAHTFQLQDVLRDQGYQTWFLLSGNHRAWNGLPFFYHSTDETLFDGSQSSRYTMDDDRVVLEGLERVPAVNPDQPAFFYLHLMSTHYLGVQMPESHVFTRPDDEVSPGAEPYKMLAELNKPDRYDDKVRQADGIIRQIFAALRAKGYLDEAIVVVTGDHGEGLGERHWAHGWNLYNEDIRIPLLIYDVPSVRYPDLAFAAQVDIAPTIVDRLGLPIPVSWEGQSLLSPTRQRFTFHQTYFLPNRFAVLYRNDNMLYKFIATPDYGQEELYDLTHDAREARNLVKEQPGLTMLLREKVRSYRTE